MIELVRPRAELFGAWAEAHREWGPGLHEDGFGIGAEDNVDTIEGIQAWIARTQQDLGKLWGIVEDGESPRRDRAALRRR